jgi:hypothetical protein
MGSARNLACVQSDWRAGRVVAARPSERCHRCGVLVVLTALAGCDCRDPRSSDPDRWPPPTATVAAVGTRRGLAILLIPALVFAAGGAAIALGDERDYRARAYVIQVPAALGPQRGVELARSERVLRETIELAGVQGIDAAELRRRSTAESTSRLDIAMTVAADRPQQAVELATAYAKAVRRSIPDDEGLPTRGVGARRAEGGLGPLRWPLIGALVGLLVGAALAIVSDGLRRGSAPGPRRASRPYARARRLTRG